MKIYVASSWRNPLQPAIVHALRRCGHEVYDFRNPKPGDTGFSWREVMPSYQLGGKVAPTEYRDALKHPIAEAGYESDITALRWCDAVVYVMPCGRSASWEFGYATGQGKAGYVVMFSDDEPDLMFSEATILTNMNELFDAFEAPAPSAQPEPPSGEAWRPKVGDRVRIKRTGFEAHVHHLTNTGATQQFCLSHGGPIVEYHNRWFVAAELEPAPDAAPLNQGAPAHGERK